MSDETKPQDSAAMSPASAGSHGADITTRLRRWTHSVDAVFASDIMDEAADEIERLRGYRDMAEADRVVAELAAERMRLTAAEREAIERAIGRELDPEWFGVLAADRVAALRGLLDRLK